MNRQSFSNINMTAFTDMKKQSQELVAYHHMKWKLIIFQKTVLNCQRYSKIVLNYTRRESLPVSSAQQSRKERKKQSIIVQLWNELLCKSMDGKPHYCEKV